LPVLVAKLKTATARMESLRATLASQQAVADCYDELDPEDLAAELRLTQEWSPDVTADRKVLRALGATIDQALREAVIDGSLGRIVASKLSGGSMSNPQTLWEVGG
jgi:hypothetical protein